jgi:iron(III) transport system substrate-binding protein
VTSRRLALLFAVVVAAALAAVGASAAGSAPQASTPKPATKAQWSRIVAAAKREGSVVIYSTQNPALLAEMAAKFKAK